MMTALMRATRLLCCTGRQIDAEALLLSVLHSQSASPSDDTQSVLRNPLRSEELSGGGGQHAPSVASALTEITRASKSHPQLSASARASGTPPAPVSPELLTQAPAGLQQGREAPSGHAEDAFHREMRAPAPAARDSPDSACFTLTAAAANPAITFPEILMQWERFVEGYGAHYAEQLSPAIRRREAALLNYKLEDPVLGYLAHSAGAVRSASTPPKIMAPVFQADQRWAAMAQRTDGDGAALDSEPPPACYGLPHFSAELGDVGYLRSLQQQFPRGFPLRWLPRLSQHRDTTNDAFYRDADGKAAPQPSEALPFSQKYYAQQAPLSTVRATELHSFDWIAAHCPDHMGFYLGHLAACNGHIDYVQELVDLLSPRLVLREQRCVAPLSSASTWGLQRYYRNLTVPQCAVVHQQVAFLEWLECAHPTALHKMDAVTTTQALLAAAMTADSQVGVFDFFRERGLPPMDALPVRAATLRVRSPSPGAPDALMAECSELLQGSGLLRILFAAAEAGSSDVLKWFDKALVNVDVRQLCDKRGVTILHHCARGHQAHTLGLLLLHDAAAADATTQQVACHEWAPLDPRWVDVEDDQCRTPAMWCVMSAGSGKDVIATLEVLRRAGSQWPSQRHEGASLLDIATHYVSRHSKLVRYLRAHTRL